MSSALHGKFLWHELLTVDTAAAASFYRTALGWKARAWEHDPAYGLLDAGAGVLGGLRHQAGGGAPQWLAFVGVTDIGATVAAAERLGGKVQKPVADIASGGRYAVLADPQGGVIGIYQPAHAHHTDGSPMDASPAFGWHELAAVDGMAVLGFYRELFGWELADSHDMGPMGKYLLLGLAGKQFGGVFTSRDRHGWLLYLQVPGVSEAVAAVKAAGGRVVREPMQVPGGGWVAQFQDPQGAFFAVLGAERAAKPAAAPSPAAKPAEAKPAPKPAPAAPKPPTLQPAQAPHAAQAHSAQAHSAQAKSAPAKPAPPSVAPAARPASTSAPAKAVPASVPAKPSLTPTAAVAKPSLTPAAAPAKPASPSSVTVVPKAKTKPKTKSKTKPKPKLKSKPKAKTSKSKTAAKAKARPAGTRAKVKSKARLKAKPKAKGKTKARAKAKGKAKRTGRTGPARKK
jgi:uncharacterized protein